MKQLDAAKAQFKLGNLKESRAICSDILLSMPSHFPVLMLLGQIELLTHSYAAVETVIETAERINPTHPDLYHLKGKLAQSRGLFQDAIALLERGIERPGLSAELIASLGNIYHDQRQFTKARNYYELALARSPDLDETLANLGLIYFEHNQWDSAVTYLERALALNPRHSGYALNLSTVLLKMGKLTRAETILRKAAEYAPDFTEIYNNLASILKDQNRCAEANTLLHRLITSGKPIQSWMISNYLLTLNYLSTVSGEKIRNEHMTWAPSFGKASSRAYSSIRAKDNRTRIGYISADLHAHPVSSFLLPILRNHDHSRFEIFVYASGKKTDEITQLLNSNTEHWIDISNMSDGRVADQLRNDGIQVLIDLGGHMAFNRMSLFALKPVPIQVSWIGYPVHPGLPTIDAKISDEIVNPQGTNGSPCWRLPNGFHAFEPPSEAPAINELPVIKAGALTFGSFNNICKIDPFTIKLWSHVLHKHPQSRLMLKSRSFCDSAVAKRMTELFAAQGIEPHRLILQTRKESLAEHLSLYGEIDIALDTFPYNGTTTTCEALWMGVPVVTLQGSPEASRVSSSLLHQIGHPEWIAKNASEFAEIVGCLVSDIDKLSDLRKSLRTQVQASALCNHALITRDFENAVEQALKVPALQI
jgi:predicted O-linked N-acetylglucosamine transferase (SPINDLY family)